MHPLLQLVGTEIVKALAKEGATAAIKRISAAAADRPGSMSPDDITRLTRLLGADEGTYRRTLASEFKFTDRRGVVIIGPSGAGKTVLRDYLVSGDVHASTSVQLPTRRVSKASAVLDKKVTVIADSVGNHAAHGSYATTLEYLKRSQPRVVILVLAYGYLQTRGLTGLVRPGAQDKPFGRVDRYIAACRAEERHWIELVKREVPALAKRPRSFMIAVNKQDLWSETSFDRIRDYYTNPRTKLGQSIPSLVRAWRGDDLRPTFHAVATTYNSFLGQAPSGAFEASLVDASLKMFRAELALNLHHARS